MTKESIKTPLVKNKESVKTVKVAREIKHESKQQNKQNDQFNISQFIGDEPVWSICGPFDSN